MNPLAATDALLELGAFRSSGGDSNRRHALRCDAASRLMFTHKLDDLCEPFKSAGIAFRSLLLEGDAAETLMQVADDVDAALIVVGRRGCGWLKVLGLGSVSDHLSHHAARPVVVVPASVHVVATP